MRALIVDDEEDIGLMTKIILKNAGVDADDCTRIKYAKKKIHKNRYDLYFLDLNLPDGSGFDLMALIRKKNQNAKIVIISAFDGPEEKQKAREIGVDTFIKKPFNKQDLYKVVNSLVNK